MKAWFEECPERLEAELTALRASGYNFTVNEEKKSQGILEITVEYVLGSGIHLLRAGFPDGYPYLPVSIIGGTLPSGRHICPTSGALCLMQDPYSTWSVQDTLAGMLNEQVKKIIHAHLNPDDAEEADDGLQRSGQYPYVPESVLLTSDWTIPQEHDRGALLIGLERNWVPNTPVRGAVLEVRSPRGEVLAKLDDRVADKYTIRISGRWVRLATPPDGKASGQGPLAEASLVAESVKRVKLERGLDIIGLLFPEESSRDTIVENWLFAIRTQEDQGKTYSLTRTDCLDQANMLARVTALHPLATKKVLVVGTGAIGSMTAWQLARAGLGEITLVDDDFMQVGNMPRWLLGLPFVGRTKVNAIRDYLSHSYPYTRVNAIPYRIGTPRNAPDAAGDLHVLGSAIETADLVIDATAEWGISHFLSDMCKRQNVAYLWVTGTPGSRGGVVGRVVPNITQGCWKCFQHHQATGNFITPVQDDAPDIQPKGCFHPTFTGTGFDMDEMSIAASRLAVSTLCQGSENAYPVLDWDVGVVNLWGKDGRPIAPEWQTYLLTPHPDCPEHE